MNYKFRFYDKEYKNWRELPDLYGDYQAHAFRTYGDGFEIRHFLNTEAQDKIKSGLLEINQWTGLQDKNGRDIYVGDIVEFEGEPTYTANKVELWRKEVIFSNRGFFGMNRGDSDKYPPHLLYPYATVCEVIGNIYENPELLNP